MKGFRLIAIFEVEKRLSSDQIERFRKARRDLAAEVESIVADAKYGSGRPIARSARYMTGAALAVNHHVPAPAYRRIIPARPNPRRPIYGAC